MKIVICDYKEPLNRDLNREISFFKEGLGDDTEVVVYEYKNDVNELKSVIADADGILTSYLEFPKDVIDSTKQLKIISIEATGYNFVDADAASKKGVGVCVIGEYCTQEVADHTITLMLAVARNLKHYRNQIEVCHKYDYNSISGMFRLEGSVLGILGLGKIGKAVAKRAQGFGLKVIAYSPSCKKEAADALGVTLVSLEELYETSNIITVNMRLTDDNVGMLDYNAFCKMKQKPVIVNVSRGAMIVEQDLVRALDEGLIFGAGLDVLETETDEETTVNPLVGRENVVITPHMAFYSDTALYECQRIASQNLVHYLNGAYDKVFRMVNQVEK